MSQMNDNEHVDRYVRITNRERFLIARALSLLENACDTLAFAYDRRNTMQRTRELFELFELRNVFCEENWRAEYPIRHTDKVISVQTMEQKDDAFCSAKCALEHNNACELEEEQNDE